MESLISRTVHAAEWVRKVQQSVGANDVFGETRSAVLWTDTPGPNAEVLAINPEALVEDVNTNGGYSLLKGHDPGFPLGKALAAATFTSPDGTKFVAAVLGFYRGNKPTGFGELELGLETPLSEPRIPEPTDDAWIAFEVDPREVAPEWISEALAGAPLRVEQTELSHNAADAVTELIRIGMPYAFLVWNPFIKAILTEAGKDTYAAMKQWLKCLLKKLPKLKSPITELVSHYGDCQTSFLLRGSKLKSNQAALEKLSLAAQQAAALIRKMTAAGFAPVKIIYEFNKDDERWYPSFAELKNGLLITDNAKLTAVDELPLGLSLGIALQKLK